MAEASLRHHLFDKENGNRRLHVGGGGAAAAEHGVAVAADSWCGGGGGLSRWCCRGCGCGGLRRVGGGCVRRGCCYVGVCRGFCDSMQLFLRSGRRKKVLVGGSQRTRPRLRPVTLRLARTQIRDRKHLREVADLKMPRSADGSRWFAGELGTVRGQAGYTCAPLARIKVGQAQPLIFGASVGRANGRRGLPCGSARWPTFTFSGQGDMVGTASNRFPKVTAQRSDGSPRPAGCGEASTGTRSLMGPPMRRTRVRSICFFRGPLIDDAA